VCSSDLALEADGAGSAGCCGTEAAGPQPVEIGFATGIAHGRSGDPVG
jgi:hypothetical protein